MNNNVTDFISGFSGEKGEFTAAIRLNPDLSICFEFPTAEDRTVGKCPLCQSRVIIGKQTIYANSTRRAVISLFQE